MKDFQYLRDSKITLKPNNLVLVSLRKEQEEVLLGCGSSAIFLVKKVFDSYFEGECCNSINKDPIRIENPQVTSAYASPSQPGWPLHWKGKNED